MFGGGLALAVGLVVGAIPSTEHVLIGVIPSVDFEIRLNGVELSSSPVPSSSVGILTFTIPEASGEGTATLSVRSTELPSPSLICGESPR